MILRVWVSGPGFDASPIFTQHIEMLSIRKPILQHVTFFATPRLPWGFTSLVNTSLSCLPPPQVENDSNDVNCVHDDDDEADEEDDDDILCLNRGVDLGLLHLFRARAPFSMSYEGEKGARAPAKRHLQS